MPVVLLDFCTDLNVMDRPNKAHPLQDSWNQLLRNQSRSGESRRRSSWWPGGRKDEPILKDLKQEPSTPMKGENIRLSSATGHQNTPDRGAVPDQQPYSLNPPDSIQLKDGSDREARVSRRTTKSDGGSVGSNLKKLSIDDRRGLQPASPPAAARPKRAAEPFGQVPEGETRPLKRQGPTLKEQTDHTVSADFYDPDSPSVVANVQPGLIQLPKPLTQSTLDHSTSGSARSPINEEHREAEVQQMLLQPETRPITQDQLVNEVKGIYAGLVMVEKKCVEIDQQQSKTTNKLSDEQWQALIALHRTLLYEHHDFFLASQHPSSSAALRRLATKYAMPARMWRHGIHSFLELLRHRLPDSLDHMLAFVYLAYSMMALLMESVPSFVETWIECLGDLARYRMAIEEIDLRDREIWSGCAKMWYEKAADKSPNVGRIQHHLAVLARPNIVQQLFYYSKALVSVTPFQNARESVMLLFNPFIQEGETFSQKYTAVEAAFVTFHGVLFTHGIRKLFYSNVDLFLSGFDAHIGRTGSKFRTQGPEIVSSLCAAAFDFGNSQTYLMKAFHQNNENQTAQEAASKDLDPSILTAQDPLMKLRFTLEYWKSLEGDPEAHPKADPRAYQEMDMDSKVSDNDETAAQAVRVLGQATKIVAQRIGDKNIVPFMHVLLAFLWSLAPVPGALLYVQGEIPWESLATFLNTVGRSGVEESRVIGDEFPQQLSGTGTQLPEDFPMRGLLWAQHYFPAGFFQGDITDEDERTLDLPSHAAPRAERCLWLGFHIASLDRWLVYNKENRQFAATVNVHSYITPKASLASESQSHTLSVDSESDIQMLEVPA